MKLPLPVSYVTYPLPYSEQLLVNNRSSFKDAEESAFSDIYHKYFPDLYRYAFKITKDAATAEDYVQDLFFTIWYNRGQLGHVKSIYFYLFAALRHNLARAIKNQKKYLPFQNLNDFEPDIEFSAEEIILSKDYAEQDAILAAQMLNSLPKRQREVIYLKYYEELAFEEIAELMSLNYQSVINHAHKAFKALRKNEIFAGMYKSNK